MNIFGNNANNYNNTISINTNDCNKTIAISNLSSYISQSLNNKEYNTALNTYSECLQTILNVILTKTNCSSINGAITNLINNETNIHTIIVYTIQMLREMNNNNNNINISFNDTFDKSFMVSISEITNAEQILSFIKKKQTWLYQNCNFKNFLIKIIELNINDFLLNIMSNDQILYWKIIYEEIINNYHYIGNNLYLINTMWYQELRIIYLLYCSLVKNNQLVSLVDLDNKTEEKEEEEKNTTIKIVEMKAEIDQLRLEIKRNLEENNKLKDALQEKITIKDKMIENETKNNEELVIKNTELLRQLAKYEQLVQANTTSHTEEKENIKMNLKTYFQEAMQRNESEIKQTYELQLKTNKEEFDKTLNDYNEQVKELRNEIERLNGENATLMNTIETLKKTYAEHENELLKLKSNVEDENKKLIEHKRKLEDEVKNLNDKLDEQHMEYETSLEDTLNENAASLQRKIQEMEYEKSELESERDKYIIALKEESEKYNAALSEIESLSGNDTSLQRKIQEMGKSSSENIANLESKFKEENEKYNAALSEIEELKRVKLELINHLHDKIYIKLKSFYLPDRQKEIEQFEQLDETKEHNDKYKVNLLLRFIDQFINKIKDDFKNGNEMNEKILGILNLLKNNDVKLEIGGGLASVDILDSYVKYVIKLYKENVNENENLLREKIEFQNTLTSLIKEINDNLNESLIMKMEIGGEEEGEEEEEEEEKIRIIQEINNDLFNKSTMIEIKEEGGGGGGSSPSSSLLLTGKMMMEKENNYDNDDNDDDEEFYDVEEKDTPKPIMDQIIQLFEKIKQCKKDYQYQILYKDKIINNLLKLSINTFCKMQNDIYDDDDDDDNDGGGKETAAYTFKYLKNILLKINNLVLKIKNKKDVLKNGLKEIKIKEDSLFNMIKTIGQKIDKSDNDKGKKRKNNNEENIKLEKKFFESDVKENKKRKGKEEEEDEEL